MINAMRYICKNRNLWKLVSQWQYFKVHENIFVLISWDFFVKHFPYIGNFLLYLFKAIWASIFLEVSALLDARHCPKVQSCAIWRKTNDENLKNSKKYIMVNYHHVLYQKKLMIRSWENLVTDRRRDKQTDENKE